MMDMDAAKLNIIGQMEGGGAAASGPSMAAYVATFCSLAAAVWYVVVWWASAWRRRLPPGSLGWVPLLGESLAFVRLARAGRLRDFVGERARRHGPVFKTCLVGRLTLVDTAGPAFNKFLFANDNGLSVARWPRSVLKLVGERSVLTAEGAHHRRLRAALATFLRPQALQAFFTRVREAVRSLLRRHFDGRDAVVVLPLMKRFTLTLACTLLLGVHVIDDDPDNETSQINIDRLYGLFSDVVGGLLALPINLPGTRYRKGVVARRALDVELRRLLADRKRDLAAGASSAADHDHHHLLLQAPKDALSCLIMEKADDGSPLLSDDELLENLIAVFIGAFDTTSSALTLFFKFAAENPASFDEVVKEQEQIVAQKKQGEDLIWQDLQNMKCLWRFIQETIRICPPIDMAFRAVIKELKHGDFVIPKGWQVLWTPYSSHLKEDLYSSPQKFDPSRFEGNGPPPFSYVPFGGGARSCPGMEFSKMIMLILTHYLSTTYRWNLTIKDEPIRNLPSPTPERGLPIELIHLTKSNSNI